MQYHHPLTALAEALIEINSVTVTAIQGVFLGVFALENFQSPSNV